MSEETTGIGPLLGGAILYMLLLIYTLHVNYPHWQSKDWIQTQGLVTEGLKSECRVSESSGRYGYRRLYDHCRVLLKYQYVVDKKTYNGTIFTYGKFSEYINGMEDDYAVKNSVAVFYNPAAPSDAMLRRPGIFWLSLIMTGILLFFPTFWLFVSLLRFTLKLVGLA